MSGLGDIGHASLIEGRGEKVVKMFDALFDRTDPSVVSIREAYVQMTGDKQVTGMVRECDRVLLREALDSSSLGEVLGDAITRRMIADYRETNTLDWWMRLVSVIPVNDFRAQHRIRWGGYGNLPAVEEGAPYTELSSPGDEEETYAPSKRGGTESVTLEAIKNDDMSQLLRIPSKLSRSAKRTVSAFAAAFFTANANLADGVALFHATHSNLGSRRARQDQPRGRAPRDGQAKGEGLRRAARHRPALPAGPFRARANGLGPLPARHRAGA